MVAMRWSPEEKAVTRPARRVRQQFLLLAQMLVTAGLLYLAFRGVDVAAALDRIWRMPLAVVFLCFLLFAIQMLVLALRWNWLLAFFRCRVAAGTLIRGVLAERFVNQLIPSTVGGDSARFVTLVGDGVSRSPAFLSVVFDRVSGTLSIVVLAGVTSPLAILYGMDPRGALLPTALAASTAIAVLTVACTRRRFLLRFAGLFRSPWLSQLTDTSHQMLRSGQFYQATCLMSTLVHVLSCAVFVLIAVALLGSASFSAVAVCAPIILVATAVPITVGGWGLRESMSVALLRHAGIAAEDALGIAILFGIIQLLTGLLAGIVLLGLQIGHPLQREKPLQPEQRSTDEPM
jgi:hypothetical protein